MKAIGKKIIGFLMPGWLPLLIWGQTIEIHQIDIGVGDATLIKIRNTTVGDRNILIDAGLKGASTAVIDYLKKVDGGNLGATPYIDYIIASHYHADHIGGFVGTKLPIPVGCAIYNGVLSTDWSKINYCAVLDKGDAKPVPGSMVYAAYKNLAGARRVPTGLIASGNLVVNPLPQSVPAPMPVNQSLRLGGYIDFGKDANGVSVILKCVASDARVYKTTVPYYVDAAEGVNRNNPGSKANPNNWGLAWVLEYGKFRYYTGGDLGGYNTGNYLDVETPLAESFPNIYPNPTTAPGHICAFKIDHHGSEHSSNDLFLQTLKSTTVTISCAEDYNHPTQQAIDRLEDANWKSVNLNYDNTPSYYMTELWYTRNINIDRGATSGNIDYVVTNRTVPPSSILRYVDMAFPNPGKLYVVNRPAGIIKGDIIIGVFPNSPKGVGINDLSCFKVRYRDFEYTTKWIIDDTFVCHN
jgi:Metallo-beta-lactamase superfamily